MAPSSRHRSRHRFASRWAIKSRLVHSNSLLFEIDTLSACGRMQPILQRLCEVASLAARIEIARRFCRPTPPAARTPRIIKYAKTKYVKLKAPASPMLPSHRWPSILILVAWVVLQPCVNGYRTEVVTTISFQHPPFQPPALRWF